MAHVARWKENQVSEMVQLMSDNPVIGIVNISGLAGPQMQKMRMSLRNKATLKISKINLITHAIGQIENNKTGVAELKEALDGQVALITTDMNPFKLFKVLEEAKTKAPVKGGETLDEDVDIKAGETSFKPGPIVGELQRVGIPAAIEQGKVVIKKDKTLVKAGEPVSRDVAQMLTRLEIYPLTVGLDLRAVFEDGVVFKQEDLAIDQQQYLDNLSLASTNALNLAFNINYVNPVTVIPLIQIAHGKAMNLMFNADIITPESIEFMLQKASGQMLSLASNVGDDALDDELKDKLGSVSAQAETKQVSTKEDTDKKKESKKGAKKESKKEAKGEKVEEAEEAEEVSEEEAAAGLGALFD
jgi:large subunit ribosomal protein L10